MSLVIHRVEAVDDAIRALFADLHEAQVAVAPSLGPLPARPASEAWSRRRSAYEQWLGVRGAFALLASEGERPVGFALVTLGAGFHGWVSGERVAELKELSVAPEVRGQGIGSRLMDAVDAELICAGITELRMNVIAANERALRFYERRGLVPVTTVLLGRVGAGRAPRGT